MTTADILNLVALPVATLAMAAAGWACTRIATYFREKAHNERLARLVDGIGRIAGDVAGKLQTLPPGASFAVVKAAAIDTGVADAKARFAETIVGLGGATDATLAGMIAGEVGKLTAPAAATSTHAAVAAVTAIAQAIDASPVPAQGVRP
jgi:hypothetical protein